MWVVIPLDLWRDLSSLCSVSWFCKLVLCKLHFAVSTTSLVSYFSFFVRSCHSQERETRRRQVNKLSPSSFFNNDPSPTSFWNSIPSGFVSLGKTVFVSVLDVAILLNYLAHLIKYVTLVSCLSRLIFVVLWSLLSFFSFEIDFLVPHLFSRFCIQILSRLLPDKGNKGEIRWFFHCFVWMSSRRPDLCFVEEKKSHRRRPPSILFTLKSWQGKPLISFTPSFVLQNLVSISSFSYTSLCKLRQVILFLGNTTSRERERLTRCEQNERGSACNCFLCITVFKGCFVRPYSLHLSFIIEFEKICEKVSLFACEVRECHELFNLPPLTVCHPNASLRVNEKKGICR